MSRTPSRSFVLPFVLAIALGACAMDGGRGLFGMAPAGVDTKIVVLEVVDTDKGTMAVGSQAVDQLQRRQGVYGVRRDALRNQVFVLCDAMAAPDALADSLAPDYRARVVKVMYPDDAAK